MSRHVYHCQGGMAPGGTKVEVEAVWDPGPDKVLTRVALCTWNPVHHCFLSVAQITLDGLDPEVPPEILADYLEDHFGEDRYPAFTAALRSAVKVAEITWGST